MKTNRFTTHSWHLPGISAPYGYYSPTQKPSIERLFRSANAKLLDSIFSLLLIGVNAKGVQP